MKKILEVQLNPLRPGSVVDVIAPASRASDEELKDGVKALRDLGLVPRVPRDLFAKKSVLFSNDDDVRLAHLKAALYAEDSDLIWCVRGGYGALRLLPAMSKWRAPKRAKMLLGYSDITTLHSFLNEKWGWPTLHGPLLDRFGGNRMGARECRALLNILYGKENEVEFRRLRPLNEAAATKRTLRGRVVGGNFTVLQSSLGTPFAFSAKGRIVFLEDTGERPHRVDRMLTQFAQAGVFAGAKAIVLGHFQLSNEVDRRHLWRDVFTRFASELKLPLLAGVPVGHDTDLQLTLPLGTAAELQTGSNAMLRVETGIALA